MVIVSHPHQDLLDQLEKILHEEIRKGEDIDIVDLGSNLECWHCVAIENDHPIGAATVRYCSNELFKLYVAPQHRRKHVAEKLVKYVMNRLKNEGKTDMFVEMVDNSIPFWEKFINNNKLKFKKVSYQAKIEIILE
ncbi:TPA: GNAT family N-acetyltransferase [Klebsiella variicola subsp. variicola]|uniref:GNAT family N-acetyltransferase n=1 Tax=Klebsiella variicola TaxID=244366 RepID=UPI0033043E75|nr:GNAT family N-acetyltransferase [Klebsiella variicola subsp. variicola]